MKEITIYSKEVCPYCVKAKSLLQRKKVKFSEIKITDEETKNQMIAKSGGRMTVPQIFIGDFHVGGCDDLYQLDADGKLNDLLAEVEKC